MKKIHTHYDNLQVARNASPEVIRGAYRMLSQKYHPDVNPGNPDANRIMAIVNEAYEVLSDPERRRMHDRWIQSQEAKGAGMGQSTPAPAAPRAAARYELAEEPKAKNFVDHLREYWGIYVVLAFFVWIYVEGENRTPPPGPKPYVAEAPARPAYVRPQQAPNGQPWPSGPGYVAGYKKLNTSGLSTVTVNNSQNDSDVFVKLVSLNTASAFPVRQFYIPAFGSFTLNNVTPGQYDIRYRDLGTGGLSRSESFSIEQRETYDGVQFSNFTMTLYKVSNGNMKTYSLGESEF